jgi:hypothetical protein
MRREATALKPRAGQEGRTVISTLVVAPELGSERVGGSSGSDTGMVDGELGSGDEGDDRSRGSCSGNSSGCQDIGRKQKKG